MLTLPDGLLPTEALSLSAWAGPGRSGPSSLHGSGRIPQNLHALHVPRYCMLPIWGLYFSYNTSINNWGRMTAEASAGIQPSRISGSWVSCQELEGLPQYCQHSLSCSPYRLIIVFLNYIKGSCSFCLFASFSQSCHQHPCGNHVVIITTNDNFCLELCFRVITTRISISSQEKETNFSVC